MGDTARKPFKDFVDAAAVDRLASVVHAAWPAFDVGGFRAAASNGLDALELTPRVAHIGEALRRHLPAEFETTARILQAVPGHWSRSSTQATGDFATWPLFHVVPASGLEHFELGMETLRVLTPMFSAEGAIRPFLERYGERAFAVLHRWTADPDPHVRRLVSEGTRPRLPWFSRVRRLTDDPKPGLALLDRLVDDDSLYVRRSVANHLNDVSRDHPDAAVSTARAWLQATNARREWVVKHALRSLVKAGRPEVFELLGHDSAPAFRAGPLVVAPERVPFGGRVSFSTTLAATGSAPARWVVDFELGFVGARAGVAAGAAAGAASELEMPARRKVFKGTTVTLEPGTSRTFEFAYDFRPITTRRYYPGRHTFTLLVNGQAAATGSFNVLAP